MPHNERGYTGPRDNDTGFAGSRIEPNQKWSYTPPGSEVDLNEPIWQSENYNRGAFAGWPNQNWQDYRPTSGLWQVRGPHLGKGPKGERQDAFIQEEVSENLSDHPQLDASELSVFVENGVVTLDGTVDSRWAKRAAERAADSVSGVKDVRNQLVVRQVAEADRRQDLAARPFNSDGGAFDRGAMRQPNLPAAALRLQPGMPVFGAQGGFVGTIKQVRNGDFLVDRNLERDVYVPFAAVTQVRGDRVLIAVPRTAVDETGWPFPPVFGG